MPDIKCLFLAKKDKSLYQKNCVIGLLSSLGMTFPFLEYDGRIPPALQYLPVVWKASKPS